MIRKFLSFNEHFLRLTRTTIYLYALSPEKKVFFATLKCFTSSPRKKMYTRHNDDGNEDEAEESIQKKNFPNHAHKKLISPSFLHAGSLSDRL